MRYTLFVSAAFAALATASPLKRDVATIEAAFANVTSALTTLDAAINAITATSDPASTEATLEGDAMAVVDALNTGAANINATAAITLLDSLNLVNASNILISDTNSTINDLISKYDIVNTNGQTAAVLTALNQQKVSTQGFIAAVGSKVPSQALNFVQSQGQQVIDSINRGIVAYGGTVSSKVRRGLGALFSA